MKRLIAVVCLFAVSVSADIHGAKGGLVVCIGSEAAESVSNDWKTEPFVFQCLETSPEKVSSLRKKIRAAGCYGKVSVSQFDGFSLPYADNLVNLVIVGSGFNIPRSELERVLAPKGVVSGFKSQVSSFKKPWPTGMDEWTHWKHAADGNMVSQDRLIGPPRRTQWTAGPLWQRHHGTVPSITTMVSSQGRVFYIMEDVPMSVNGLPGRWFLYARDAFNGTLLWKRPIKEWGSAAWSYWTEGHSARFNHPIHIRKRLVSVGDRVFATLGLNAPVSMMDAATGRTLKTYEGTEFTDEFVVFDGVLYLSVNDRKQEPWPGEGVLPEPTATPESKKRIWAVNPNSGQVLWKSGEFIGKQAKPDRLGSMKHLTLTVCGKGVFIADAHNLVCLDLKTGRQRWKIPQLKVEGVQVRPPKIDKLYHNMLRVGMTNLVYYKGILFVMTSGPNGNFKWVAESVLQALDPQTGKELWQYKAMPINYLDEPDLLCSDGLVWMPHKKEMFVAGLDPKTGKVVRKFDLTEVLDVRHHHRCYPNRATPNYLILGRRGAEFVDLKTGEITLHHWMRSGCRYGHLLANGLIYKLPDYCRCYTDTEPRGFLALAAEKQGAGSKEQGAGGTDQGTRLVKGSAYNSTPHAPSSSLSSWPTFRGNAFRGSGTTTRVPSALKQAWSVKLGGKITPPVVADGRVFLAAVDEHTIYALDENSGKKRWAFTAEGRIDSPPTIHGETVIFGSADGWVYCLRASDGARVWKFRAAPRERRIMNDGQPESTWPVSGSVLAVGNTAYFTAGRSSLLDGGMIAYAVNARTGALIEALPIQEVQTNKEKGAEGFPQGAMADILLTDGEGVYLRGRKLGFARPVEGIGRSAARLQVQGGFLDSEWFHRIQWNLGKLSGNLIAFDDKSAYAVAAYGSHNPSQSFFIPDGGSTDRVIGSEGFKGAKWLDIRVYSHGYHLTAAGLDGSAATDTKEMTKAEKRKARRSKSNKSTGKSKTRWGVEDYPLCPWAMIAAPDALVVAGFSNTVNPRDPWANYDGRCKGQLRIVSGADGKPVAQYELNSPPVWNGMAAAYGKLFISKRDGSLDCWSGK